MDSVVQRLMRPRPAKYSFGQALGVAMQGAGQYYGQMAIDKRNAEALEEARNYQEEQQLASEQRMNAEWDRRTGVERDNALADYNMQAADAQSASDETVATRESVMGEDGRIHIFGFNSRGEQVADLGVDPDYVVGPDGTAQRLSAGGRGGPGSDQTEAQIKYQMFGTVMEEALGGMTRMLGGDGSAEYDLRSLGALKDQVADRFGSFGNWITSAEGRRFQNYARVAGETLFKGWSGAAGSDAEAERFYSMFPRAGDDEATIATKVDLLGQVTAEFKRAAEMTGYDEQATVNHIKRYATVLATGAGFDLESGQYQQNNPSNVIRQSDDSGLTADDWRYIQ